MPVRGEPRLVRNPELRWRARNVDRRWDVALVAFAAQLLMSFADRCSGFLCVGYMDLFLADRRQANWPQSIAFVVNFTAGLVVSLLQRRLSLSAIALIGAFLTWVGPIGASFAADIPVVTLCMGLIHGLGSGIFFVSISIVLMMYFDRYRGIVNGIKNLGGTAASVVFPNLLLLVRDAYGFRACLLLYGALAMHLTPLGMLTKEPPRSRAPTTSPLRGVGARKDDANCEGHQETPTNEKNSQKSKGKRSISSCGFCAEVKELFATPVFYVIVVSGVVGYYTQSVFFATIVDFARDKGFSLAESASVMVYFGLTETMGRLCLPFAADRGLVRRSTLSALSFAAMAASIVLLERSESLLAIKVGATVFAAFFGAAVTVEGVVIADYLGVDSLSFVFGFTGAVSVPLFFGNPFVLGEYVLFAVAWRKFSSGVYTRPLDAPQPAVEPVRHGSTSVTSQPLV
ncbi:monocarboxylate transporter 12-like [Haemaphysalis longicornis]